MSKVWRQGKERLSCSLRSIKAFLVALCVFFFFFFISHRWKTDNSKVLVRGSALAAEQKEKLRARRMGGWGRKQIWSNDAPQERAVDIEARMCSASNESDGGMTSYFHLCRFERASLCCHVGTDGVSQRSSYSNEHQRDVCKPKCTSFMNNEDIVATPGRGE